MCQPVSVTEVCVCVCLCVSHVKVPGRHILHRGGCGTVVNTIPLRQCIANWNN